MKRLLLALVALLCVFTAACAPQTREDQVLKGIGKCVDKQVWTQGEHQDYMDFGVYIYSTVDVGKSKLLAPVGEEHIGTVIEYVNDFVERVDALRVSDPDAELVKNYSFDRSMIDPTDSFYIYEDETYPKFGCYDVWLFDSLTQTVYYFHSNT